MTEILLPTYQPIESNLYGSGTEYNHDYYYMEPTNDLNNSLHRIPLTKHNIDINNISNIPEILESNSIAAESLNTEPSLRYIIESNIFGNTLHGWIDIYVHNNTIYVVSDGLDCNNKIGGCGSTYMQCSESEEIYGKLEFDDKGNPYLDLCAIKFYDNNKAFLFKCLNLDIKIDENGSLSFQTQNKDGKTAYIKLQKDPVKHCTN